MRITAGVPAPSREVGPAFEEAASLPLPAADLAGLGEVVREILFEARREPVIPDGDVDLVVQAEGAVAEIRRADHAPGAIYQHRLRREFVEAGNLVGGHTHEAAARLEREERRDLGARRRAPCQHVRVVEQEQVGPLVLAAPLQYSVPADGGDRFCDQFASGDGDDGRSGVARVDRVANRVRQVRLADARRAGKKQAPACCLHRCDDATVVASAQTSHLNNRPASAQADSIDAGGRVR